MPKRKRPSSGNAPKPTPRVSQADHDAILAALRNVEWNKVRNTSRKNVIPEDAPKGAKGKPFCHSFILGPVMKDPEKKPSFWTTENPELFRLLNELMHNFDPDHKFTNITINKNLRCKAHMDRGNFGMSYIVGFGDYSGGELMVCPRQGPNSKKIKNIEQRAKTCDLHRRFVSFYGGEQLHWTNDFEGERYTCVFYNFPELHQNAAKLKQVTDTSTSSIAPSSKFASKLSELSKRLKQSQKKRFNR